MDTFVPKRILTGDRPTGPLHIGHLVGSLQNRVAFQEHTEQYILIADTQALSDNVGDEVRISNGVREVVKDYLAVGIDPEKTTLCLQSALPALSEITLYYLNLVSVSRLKQNPTVKHEIEQKGFGEQVPAGFLIYPVSQAADITAFKADGVPVGDDQIPMIEQTNEIVRKFNRIYETSVLVEAQSILSKTPRLSGIDGNAKMSKSLNNAVYLKDTPEEIREKIHSAYTDPHHIHINDPGVIEGNVVFEYLDVFDTDTVRVEQFKKHYQQGGLGDSELKEHLASVMTDILRPIGEKRASLSDAYVDTIIQEGTTRANDITNKTLGEIKKAMCMYVL